MRAIRIIDIVNDTLLLERESQSALVERFGEYWFFHSFIIYVLMYNIYSYTVQHGNGYMVGSFAV